MRSRVRNGVVTAACIGLGAWLLMVILTLPREHAGLGQTVAERMPESGVSHPVTAVLLNFRGYDTLLEIGVVLLALISTWSIQPARAEDASPAGRVQSAYLRAVIPMLVLFAGYVLWIGAKAPGGAFQAGAILAAAAILLRLSDLPAVEACDRVFARILLTAGFGCFLLVAFGLLATGRGLLAYPISQAGALILAIEAAGTVSIGLALFGMFLGRRWRFTGAGGK